MALEKTPEEAGRKNEPTSPEFEFREEELRAFCECRHKTGILSLYSAVEVSTLCGCALCRLYCKISPLIPLGLDLWRMKKEEINTRLLAFENMGLSDETRHQYHNNSWRMSRKMFNEDGISFFLIEADSSLADVPVQKPPPNFTGSDQSFRKAKVWLRDCLENHSRHCSASQFHSPLPKRVLDLENFPDGIRLLEDSADTAPYVCLSHCWGDPAHHPLKTMSQNIESHRRGIKFAGLPKTFQEAAMFVHLLGYRYLWIDSLCIIQDDEGDWRVQASKMASIYQGCLLTIAANAGPNSWHGLFSHQSPASRGMLLSAMTGEESDHNVWMNRNSIHERGPLDTRGWVLQERLLSPRTLYFERDELTWECLEARRCQCVSGVIPNDLKMKIRQGFECHPQAIETSFSNWDKVVEEYSHFQLTHEEDVFPAISGISKLFRSNLGSQYIAGLWRDNIFQGLCWMVSPVLFTERVFFSVRRSTKWRAPSFSWASVVIGEGSGWGINHRKAVFPGMHHTKSIHPCVKLVDARCVPVGADDTGQLSDAYIDLEGTLVEARIIRSNDDDGRWSLACGSHIDSFSFYADYDYDVVGPDQIVSGDEVFCLLVLQNRSSTFGCHSQSLVLRKSKHIRGTMNYSKDATGISVYERIGLLTEIRMEFQSVENLTPGDLSGSKVVVRIV